MQEPAEGVDPAEEREQVEVVVPAAVITPDDANAADGASTAVSDTSRIDAILDRIMSVQRPAVLAHLRGIRARHPEAGTAEVLRILERRYLATVTTSGAGVGIAAAVPAVGTGAALALSGAETVLFLEATALFAQSVAELHGIPVDDPDRARALVLALVVGGPAQELLQQLAGQAAGGGSDKQQFWGALIAKNLPRTAVMQFMDRVRKVYLPRMLASAGGGVVGRILPFGVGAVIGGTANQLLGRRVVTSARLAFGPPPPWFPAGTAPVAPAPRAVSEKRRRIRRS